MTRTLVYGGRGYTDFTRAFAELDAIDAEVGISLVIEGGQRMRDPITGQIVGGADYWGFQWAKARGKSYVTVRAEWHKHGRAAGPLRNQRMIDEHAPQLGVEFFGGRGTADMARRLHLEGIEVRQATPTQDPRP